MNLIFHAYINKISLLVFRHWVNRPLGPERLNLTAASHQNLGLKFNNFGMNFGIRITAHFVFIQAQTLSLRL